MDVIVDVVAAEAVIARAARAVAKLQLGVVRIRPAADGALVGIKLISLLAPDAGGFFFEVERGLAGTARQQRGGLRGYNDAETRVLSGD